MTPVGPPVPLDIQRIRAERRKKAQLSAVSSPALHLRQEAGKDSDQDGSSSDDDDAFGPQLADTESHEDAEKQALERLKARSLEQDRLQNDTTGNGQKNMADKSNWMAFALGQKPEEVSYNPKTFRRNISSASSISTASTTETENERTKRMADEMMGLSKSNDSKTKRSKTEPKDEDVEEDDVYFVARRDEPSLLDQHLMKRREEKKAKSKSKKDQDNRFNWERDMKGGTVSSRKVQEIVGQAKDMASKFSRSTKK